MFYTYIEKQSSYPKNNLKDLIPGPINWRMDF